MEQAGYRIYYYAKQWVGALHKTSLSFHQAVRSTFEFLKPVIFSLGLKIFAALNAKNKDWREFLVKRLTGARTIPQNFHEKVNNALKSKYE